ncbi:unnamed protein product [Boreogadus saida]
MIISPNAAHLNHKSVNVGIVRHAVFCAIFSMAWRSFAIYIGMLLLAITRCHCVALSKVPSPNPSVIWKFNSRGNSPQTKPKEAHSLRGRLMNGRHLRENAIVEEALVDADYQSDMGRDEAEAYVRAQGNGNANPSSVEVQKLMQTEPNVECTGDSMNLNVKGSFSTPGAIFLVDRGSSLAPLPLSELPSNCGYTLKTTQRDLVLVAPYDGCFVSLEEEGYVLSLHLWGIPVRMSCPVRRRSLYNPPRVTCNTAGMVVNTDWASPVQKIQVNLNGLWKPLMEVLPRCGFGFEFASNAGGAAISIRYAPCLGVKDGMFTLGLAGDGAVKVSCPSVHIFDDSSKGVLPTVAPLKYPNNTLTGTLVGQEQNSLHLPPKAQITVMVPPKNPASPDNKQPQAYPSYYFWPPHPSGSQTPEQFPPHQTPFYPSLPVGPSQKPASPTSKAEGQEPVTPHKPPKTHDSKTPLGPEGQNAWPYPFPYHFWPPQPSQGPDLPTPGVPQKPCFLWNRVGGGCLTPTSKTEGQEPVTHPKPHKTHDRKTPVVPEGHNTWPYQVPYNTKQPPSASQTPDQFPPYYLTPFYPSLPVGPSQKPASPTSKTQGQEPLTHPKPPKTWDTTNLQPIDPLATVTQTKPSESEKGTPFNSLVHCPEKCLSGLSQCCVSFSYHHHDHFIYPLKDDRRIAPFSTLGKSVPEVMQGTLDSIVNPPFENQEDKLHNFLSRAVKYASKGNQEFEYSPPEGILDQDLPISFESSQSELGHPTFNQQFEQPKIELQSPDERQSPSQTLVTQGLFTILEPAMGHYDMVQDAMASSVDSTDYFEALHPLSNSRNFVKLTSERPLSNGHLLLEHGPPGSEPSFPRLAAKGLGRSHTHLAFEPLRHYPQSKETSHPPQPGNQMDAMYRSKDQSNNILGQTFNRHSSVDGYPNGEVNQPFPRRMH